MISTIKQRIYVVGLLPLAMLAVALAVFNGVSRIDEANRELRNARNVTAALLQSPAVDALIVGNTLNFEQTVKNVTKTSPALVCVTLSDARHRRVAQAGNCGGAPSQVERFPIVAPPDGLSDFNAPAGVDAVIGELGLLMNDEGIVRKRRQAIFQLALSLVMVAAVLGFTGRLLRTRLIEPIQRIGGAMRALSQRDYSARVPVEGEDELTRLAQAINNTIATIATYTRELERRRSDADRALHDADEANLALGGLVRSLTEDLKEPMSLMHSELIGIAIANSDPALRDRIKEVIALLQEVQTDFAELIEIATSAQGVKQPPPRDLADILSDMQGDILLLGEAEGISTNFAVTQMPFDDARRGEPTGIFLDIDGVRLRKALIYLIRAMGRRCKEAGVYVNVEFIKIADNQLDVSVHLKAFYESLAEESSMQWLAGLSQYGNIPAILGWTDRETKIIDYSLRAVGVTPSVSVSPRGTVSILLDTTCRYTVEQKARQTPAGWMLPTHPISTTLVSNDPSLMRLTKRADLSNYELKLTSFSRALANPAALRAQAALLIDMSDDIAEAVTLLDRLKAGKIAVPHLIAICPSGRTSDSLSERLFDLGFAAMIQKPLYYSRIVEIVRTTLSHPKGADRDTRPGRPDKP